MNSGWLVFWWADFIARECIYYKWILLKKCVLFFSMRLWTNTVVSGQDFRTSKQQISKWLELLGKRSCQNPKSLLQSAADAVLNIYLWCSILPGQLDCGMEEPDAFDIVRSPSLLEGNGKFGNLRVFIKCVRSINW